jgi:hypothetical protein
MAYTCLGMMFLIVFGAPVLYYEIYESDTVPEGFHVFNNGSHIIPVVSILLDSPSSIFEINAYYFI